MEVLAAVGLASNVAQFLEYGITGVRIFSEVVSNADGTSKQNNELEQITSLIKASMIDVKNAHLGSPGGTSKDATLFALIDRSLKLSEEIVKILESIKMSSDRGKLRVIEGAYKAGKAMWKRDELEQLSGRLFNLRAAVSSHLIILIE